MKTNADNTLEIKSKIILQLSFWALIALLLPLNSLVNFVTLLLMAFAYYTHFYCSRKFIKKDVKTKAVYTCVNITLSVVLAGLTVLLFPECSFVKMVLEIFFISCFAVAVSRSRLLLEKDVELNVNEQQQTEIELKHLRSQLHPHFLFNTLNNIYALCEIDSKRAQQSVHYLSQLLRYILSGERSAEGGRMVAVQKEHDFIKTYLQLIYLRMRPNVHVIYNADITEFSDAPVLTLIFTSLIENAFKHGVASGKECVIEFGLEARSQTEIHFFTSNPYFKNHESNNPESGIGLENLRRRLEIVYKDDYKLDITNDGQTFRVDLTLNYTNNNYYYKV